MTLGTFQPEEVKRIYKAVNYVNQYHLQKICNESPRAFSIKHMEVLKVLSEIGADVDLIVAGILLEAYDESVESKNKLRDEFGDDVADLVFGYQGLRDVVWNERVAAECERLAKATKREQILALADIIVKQRQLFLGYSHVLGNYWSKLNIQKDVNAKYFSNVQDALYNLEFDECIKSWYWQMVNTYKDLFVKYYFDEHRFWLYQISDDGMNSYKTTDGAAWLRFNGDLPPDAICIPRELAERIEEDWDEKREPVNYDCMN